MGKSGSCDVVLGALLERVLRRMLDLFCITTFPHLSPQFTANVTYSATSLSIGETQDVVGQKRDSARSNYMLCQAASPDTSCSTRALGTEQ